MFIFRRQESIWSCFNKSIIDHSDQIKFFIELKNCINNFMNNQSIALAFDGQKQHTRQIKTDISQKSSISSILFFIYIWFLFSKIRIKIQTSSFNFIDDIQISVSSKNIENNCKILIEIVKIAFSWTDANAVQFDDSKSELIHFESKKIMSTNSIILSNETILKFQNMIKWLKIWIDRKLTFKTHVEKRLIFAIKIFHSINRLQNFEWDLASMITRQLYQTCITAISDYDFKIWWNDQKSYAEKFQNLQNLKLRKILKIFKTSSISIMKIEINIQSIKIRLNEKKSKTDFTNYEIKLTTFNSIENFLKLLFWTNSCLFFIIFLLIQIYSPYSINIDYDRLVV